MQPTSYSDRQGTPLFDRSPVVLTDCYDPLEASAIRDALSAAGISSRLDGELVSFNQVEVRNPPLVRVAAGELARAQQVLAEWRAEVAARRAERIADQNSPDDPTTDDDVYQDLYGEDGLFWDRYGRPSTVVHATFVALIAVGAWFFIFSVLR